MRWTAVLTIGTLLASAALLSAQTAPSAAAPGRGNAGAARGPIDQANIPPPFSSAPGTYSGISGPGKPVVGNGIGGYISGRSPVQYKGPEPKPGWNTQDWDRRNNATGSAITQGMIPPIKPIWDLHLRDTQIRAGGDGHFYMTGTSGDNCWDRNDGIEIWRSKDLKSWDYLGLVWSFEKDATWQKEWRSDPRSPTGVVRAIWAPEIHYIKKNYYLTYSHAGGTGTGILKSTTGKPEGPYVSCIVPDRRMGGGIDATLFEDDDGKVYYAAGGGGGIALMKEDMSRFDGPSRPLRVERPADANWRENQIAHEGVSIFKHNGRYYLTGATINYLGRYNSVAATSYNIWGPYTQFHIAVPCGAGGNYLKDNNGDWYCTYFGNDSMSPWREMPGLIKVEFGPDHKIKVADEQPAWLLREGAPTRWRTALPASQPGGSPAGN